MARDPDPRLAEARAILLDEVADRLGIAGLKRVSGELVGPCPLCGGRDRFAVAPARGVWNCRRCGGSGDGIALVRHVLGCDFPSALDWLVGGREVAPDPAEMARRRARAEAAARRQRETEARRRAEAVAEARAIWRAAVPAEGTAVRGYLELRGIPPGLLPELPPTLRFAAALPYRRAAGGQVRDWHRGPAMVAAVQDAAGRVTAVHMTWIDLRRPKGKAAIEGPDGPQPAKLVRGSKKGGAIRLSPRAEGTEALVMGEGIETTLSARVAEAVPHAAYWAGVDLGNMGGRRLSGKGLRFAGLPDLSDDRAFVPPDWVRRLVYVLDGDSDPRATRATLEAGLRRAMRLRPGLRGQIAPAPAGRDLNDVLLGGADAGS
jgi:hypothetical protein